VSGVGEQNNVSSGPPTEAPGAPASPGKGSGSIGLPVATALVMGSIIGIGVFALPSALASYGGVSLVAFVVVTVGSVALALVFGALSRRVPGSGGPYVYARDALATSPGSSTPGPTGSPPGRAMRRSPWRGSATSRCSSTPAI
jgi:APA family basic amino acid/polyamine antiporter